MAKLKKFFEGEYIDFCSYDNFRKIPNIVDGLINVRRKILFTSFKKPDSFKQRVDLFSNEVIADSKYIHGSLDDSVVKMAKDYISTNNVPYFKGYGDFGSRLSPESSATRYIQLSKSEILKLLFKKEDDNITIKQRFEGYNIEPKYYIPVLPSLLINGSSAPSVGFKNKIFPRNIRDIAENIFNYLDGYEYNDMIPYFKGFKGTVEQGKTNRQWITKGVITKKNTSTVIISELPLLTKTFYDMKAYRDILVKLKSDKKIASYQIDNDTKKDIYSYTIKFERKVLNTLDTDNKILKYLELIGTDSEILNFNDQYNKVVEYTNIYDILTDYCDIRLQAYKDRKEFILNKMKEDISIMKNKVRYINDILKDKIQFKGQKKKLLENQLKSLDYPRVERSYDYLLSMNFYSLTQEQIESLNKKISKLEDEYKKYKSKKVQDIWKEEIQDILDYLGEKRISARRKTKSKVDTIQIKKLDSSDDIINKITKTIDNTTNKILETTKVKVDLGKEKEGQSATKLKLSKYF